MTFGCFKTYRRYCLKHHQFGSQPGGFSYSGFDPDNRQFRRFYVYWSYAHKAVVLGPPNKTAPTHFGWDAIAEFERVCGKSICQEMGLELLIDEDQVPVA